MEGLAGLAYWLARRAGFRGRVLTFAGDGRRDDGEAAARPNDETARRCGMMGCGSWETPGWTWYVIRRFLVEVPPSSVMGVNLEDRSRGATKMTTRPYTADPVHEGPESKQVCDSHTSDGRHRTSSGHAPDRGTRDASRACLPATASRVSYLTYPSWHRHLHGEGRRFIGRTEWTSDTV
nr:hypothetical protein CFP56_09617 [Quercus suber]